MYDMAINQIVEAVFSLLLFALYIFTWPKNTKNLLRENVRYRIFGLACNSSFF
jgi:hypothetical protein